MRELVLTCAMAMLGSGCVSVISHADEYDAGPPIPDVKPSDGPSEAEVSMGPCQSNARWSPTSSNLSRMNPGVACLTSNCHSASSKAPFTLAGTVYPPKGERDQDNCNGTDMGGAVAVYDPSGMEILPRNLINDVGNFWSTRSYPAGFTVRVVTRGREGKMHAPLTDGNCNYCHSAEGGPGKGRILDVPP